VSFSEAFDIASKLEDAIGGVIHGQSKSIRKVLCAMSAGGHVLIQDNPGTGKTTLAKALARCISGADFKRLQFTPDLLPSDILGVSILDQKVSEFRFQPGPVFTDILLADEINRASPRTQSALLEAMAEGQVTVEGQCHDLNGLFFVLATQNPVEFRGTYPLPEAQMDRFMIQASLGYVNSDDEKAILASQFIGHPVDEISQVVDASQVLNLRREVQNVRISEELQTYIVSLVAATRGRKYVQLAASPRASLALMKMSQAMALFENKEFVTPDLIQQLVPDVVAHRVILEPEAKYSGISSRSIVQEIIEEIPIPV